MTGVYVIFAKLRHLSWDWWTAIVIFGTSLILFVVVTWLINRRQGIARGQMQSAISSSAIATQSTTQFDPEGLFKFAYNSELVGETKDNLRLGFSKIPQNEREEYCINWMAHGVIMYFYDMTWYTIYRSQILMLQDLNQKVLSLDEARIFYDRASQQYPNEYVGYSFDQWLTYMRTQCLINQQGTQIDITQRGRDFLKFLIHGGRSAQGKRF